MTPAVKRERERRTIEEMDAVIREQLKELRALIHHRHRFRWAVTPSTRRHFCEDIRGHCRILRTQLWIQKMTMRGYANLIGLTG